MRRRLVQLALAVFGRVPRRLRHRIVGWSSPAHRVGAGCWIVSDAGRVLLARHSYREGWALPGGMLGWREEPTEAARREILEEVGLRVTLTGPPWVFWERSPRRCHLVFPAAPTAGMTEADARPTSAEITEVAWFDPAELPDLGWSTTHTVRRILSGSDDLVIPRYHHGG